MDTLNKWEINIITQALLDGEGYPKPSIKKDKIGFSSAELRVVLDQLMQGNQALTAKEKQMILNCLAGALDYVDIDIPTLYDISEEQLKKFLEDLEARWEMKSTY